FGVWTATLVRIVQHCPRCHAPAPRSLDGPPRWRAFGGQPLLLCKQVFPLLLPNQPLHRPSCAPARCRSPPYSSPPFAPAKAGAQEPNSPTQRVGPPFRGDER